MNARTISINQTGSRGEFYAGVTAADGITVDTGTFGLFFRAGTADFEVDATIDAGTANQGAIWLYDLDTTVNKITVKKAVGSNKSLNTVNVGRDTTNSGGHAVFQKDVTAQTIDVRGGDAAGKNATAHFQGNLSGNMSLRNNTATATAIFGGGSNQSIDGLIDGANAGEGMLRTEAGGVIKFLRRIGSNNPLASVTVANGARTVFDDTVTTAAMVLSGDSTFNKAVNVNGVLSVTDTAEIRIGNSFTSGSTVITTTGATAGPTGAESVKIYLPSTMVNSGSVTLIDGSAGSGIDPTKYKVFDATGLYTGSTVSTDTNSQDLIVTAKLDSAAIAGSSGVSGPANGIIVNAMTVAAATNDMATVDTIRKALGSGSGAVSDMVEQLSAPADVLTATSDVVADVGRQVIDLTFGRLSSLRAGPQFANGGQLSGFSTSGDTTDNHGADMRNTVWFRPFGSTGKQKDQQAGQDVIRGYRFDTTGIVVGLDRALNRHVRLGGSLSHSISDIEGNGSGRASADIDSYQAAIYGDYTDEMFYVEGTIAYGYNEIKSTRSFDAGGVIRHAYADSKSKQYVATVSAGVPLQISGDDNYLTPIGGLRYIHLTSGGYRESGLGGLSHVVSIDDRSMFIASLGAKLHSKFSQDHGVLIPSASLGLSYDFLGERVESTARFAGGGPSFSVTGADPEQLSVDMGVGLTYESHDPWTLEVKYDVETRSDFMTHSAVVDLSFKF